MDPTTGVLSQNTQEWAEILSDFYSTVFTREERESLFYFELKHKSEFTEIDKTKKKKTVGNYKPISTFSS